MIYTFTATASAGGHHKHVSADIDLSNEEVEVIKNCLNEHDGKFRALAEVDEDLYRKIHNPLRLKANSAIRAIGTSPRRVSERYGVIRIHRLHVEYLHIHVPEDW